MRATFGRQSEPTIAKHQYPIVSQTLDVSLPQTVTVDISYTRCTRASSLSTSSTRDTKRNSTSVFWRCGRAGDLVRRTQAITPARDPHPSARPHTQDTGHRAALPSTRCVLRRRDASPSSAPMRARSSKSFLSLARAGLAVGGGSMH